MTAEERAATGIDRLSPAERAALDAWISERLSAQTEDVVVEVAPEGATAAVTPAAPSVASQSSGEGATPADTTRIEAEVERRVAAKLAAVKAADLSMEGENEFTAELKPGFTGWTGKTVFRLTNGQVWKQRSGNRYRHQGADRRVRFERNFFGKWEMTVLANGRTVGVKRVK